MATGRWLNRPSGLCWRVMAGGRTTCFIGSRPGSCTQSATSWARAGAPQRWTKRDKIIFGDFSNAHPGLLVSFTDPDGNVTAVTSYTSSTQIGEVQRSSTVGSTTITESYVYSYLTS